MSCRYPAEVRRCTAFPRSADCSAYLCLDPPIALLVVQPAQLHWDGEGRHRQAGERQWTI
eukprot:scaffold16687_cov32-Tisochrysis_lutea.AAC.1